MMKTVYLDFRVHIQQGSTDVRRFDPLFNSAIYVGATPQNAEEYKYFGAMLSVPENTFQIRIPFLGYLRIANEGYKYGEAQYSLVSGQNNWIEISLGASGSDPGMPPDLYAIPVELFCPMPDNKEGIGPPYYYASPSGMGVFQRYEIFENCLLEDFEFSSQSVPYAVKWGYTENCLEAIASNLESGVERYPGNYDESPVGAPKISGSGNLYYDGVGKWNIIQFNYPTAIVEQDSNGEWKAMYHSSFRPKVLTDISNIESPEVEQVSVYLKQLKMYYTGYFWWDIEKPEHLNKDVGYFVFIRKKKGDGVPKIFYKENGVIHQVEKIFIKQDGSLAEVSNIIMK